MDSFFDTCVVINYGTFSKLVENILTKKCYLYIVNKKDKFLLGNYIEGEIKIRINKRRVIYQEVINKLIHSEYDFEKSPFFLDLNDKDKNQVRRLYQINEKRDSFEMKQIFAEDQAVFETKIERFLKFLVDERLIAIEEIKPTLMSIMRSEGFTNPDSKVITSALQAQQGRGIFFFVTADDHFSPNSYNFLKDDPKLSEYKFPILKNFLYEN